MEIKYLKQGEIDIKKWDKCIADSINGIVYAYSWYLDIVCSKWEALVLGDYETVMPLTANKKYYINYLYQPFFTQQLGVFSTHKLDDEIVKAFIENIPSKFKFIQINLNKYNLINLPKNYKIKTNKTFEIDLIENYEDIFRKYNKNTIRNIRKAINKKISIIKGLTPNEVINLIENSEQNQNLNQKQISIIRKLIASAIRYKSGRLYGAYDKNNTLCGAGFFVFSNNKVCFILSVSNEEAKNSGAMFLLIDEFIKDNSGRNIILDFEGSNIEGVARFYAGFGAKPFNYISIKLNKLFYPLRFFKK
ncbi:MAG: hypothetical protein JXR51_02110 [Bacteroidales bacterium]|nr:hypothetical protein [Bacteroidales bacterium]MBN2755941.1 hypothetical protein [Bacteroidales bacterium]